MWSTLGEMLNVCEPPKGEMAATEMFWFKIYTKADFSDSYRAVTWTTCKIRHQVLNTFDARIRNVKCKNNNVLDVLKSSKYISLLEAWRAKYIKKMTEEARRAKYISRNLKLLEHFYFFHFTFLIRASNVVKTWHLILQVVQVIRTYSYSLGIYNFSKISCSSDTDLWIRN